MTRVRNAVIGCMLGLVSEVCTGCGGGAAQVEPHQPSSSATAEPLHGPPQPWAEMDRKARGRYMATQVLPVMARLFAEHDAERFADFGCHSCHGDNAGAVAFHMPNRLPVLWPSGTSEQRRMVELQPGMARFMFNRVLPTMTTLLGASAWDDTTQAGFGCFNCHPHAGEEGQQP